MLREFDLGGVVFDMDGTLVDSEPLHHQAYRAVVAPWGNFTEEQYNQFTGQTDNVICLWLISHFRLPLTPVELLELKKKAYPQFIKDGAIPMPGVIRFLDELTKLGARLAVGSSSELEDIELTLRAAKLRQYFQVIASGAEVIDGRRLESKPKPDVYLLAASRLNLPAGRLLGVEDSENGVRAVHAAGMRCLARPCPSTLAQDHGLADVKIDSFEHLVLTGSGIRAGNIHFRFR
jgi:beta-phosphoglucomutase